MNERKMSYDKAGLTTASIGSSECSLAKTLLAWFSDLLIVIETWK